MTAPSGDQHPIARGDWAAVVTEAGGGLRSLTLGGVDVVAPFAEEEMATGGRGQLLMPWPNRIPGGRYTFEGQDLQLALSEPDAGNAIHGLVRWVSWSLVGRSAAHVELGCRLLAQKGYPWTLDLLVRYELSDSGLTVTQGATNLAGTVAPYAQGAHPYLAPGPGPVDGWELDLGSGAAVLGDRVLDESATDLARDGDGVARCRVTDPASGRTVEVWLDDRHRWVHVYTGDQLPGAQHRSAIALEPMTAPPGAFASGVDLVALAPGERFAASWGIGVVRP